MRRLVERLSAGFGKKYVRRPAPVVNIPFIGRGLWARRNRDRRASGGRRRRVVVLGNRGDVRTTRGAGFVWEIERRDVGYVREESGLGIGGSSPPGGSSSRRPDGPGRARRRSRPTRHPQPVRTVRSRVPRSSHRKVDVWVRLGRPSVGALGSFCRGRSGRWVRLGEGARWPLGSLGKGEKARCWVRFVRPDRPVGFVWEKGNRGVGFVLSRSLGSFGKDRAAKLALFGIGAGTCDQ